jgi:DNA invertase Pin-like site-specific DNA recombinase
MTDTLIGYARCSTDKQDLTAQRRALIDLGVPEDRIYTDHGLTGRNRDRPGLAQALAAVRAGETLVVPKLDRLARSVPDARAIADELEKRGVSRALGKQVYDPSDPMGGMFFNILATFAEFESDLIRKRTHEGMKIARDKGKFRGKPPKLSDLQQRELLKMHAPGEYSISDLGKLFKVSRPTVYRTTRRGKEPRASGPAWSTSLQTRDHNGNELGIDAPLMGAIVPAIRGHALNPEPDTQFDFHFRGRLQDVAKDHSSLGGP